MAEHKTIVSPGESIAISLAATVGDFYD